MHFQIVQKSQLPLKVSQLLAFMMAEDTDFFINCSNDWAGICRQHKTIALQNLNYSVYLNELLTLKHSGIL